MLSDFIPSIINHGGSKPEVVFSIGFRCFRCFPRGLSIDSDFLRLSHFIRAISQHGGSKPEVAYSSRFRCFHVVSRWIQTVWVYPTSFRPFSIMATANRKRSPQLVSGVSHVVFRWIQTHQVFEALTSLHFGKLSLAYLGSSFIINRLQLHVLK